MKSKKFWKIFLTAISIFCMILSIIVVLYKIDYWFSLWERYLRTLETNEIKDYIKTIFYGISEISFGVLSFIFSLLLFLFVNCKDLQFLTAPIIESFIDYKKELKIKRKEKIQRDIQRKQAKLEELQNQNKDGE